MRDRGASGVNSPNFYSKLVKTSANASAERGILGLIL